MPEQDLDRVAARETARGTGRPGRSRRWLPVAHLPDDRYRTNHAFVSATMMSERGSSVPGGKTTSVPGQEDRRTFRRPPPEHHPWAAVRRRTAMGMSRSARRATMARRGRVANRIAIALAPPVWDRRKLSICDMMMDDLSLSLSGRTVKCRVHGSISIQ
jgi:hypothetical protein